MLPARLKATTTKWANWRPKAGQPPAWRRTRARKLRVSLIVVSASAAPFFSKEGRMTEHGGNLSPFLRRSQSPGKIRLAWKGSPACGAAESPARRQYRRLELDAATCEKSASACQRFQFSNPTDGRNLIGGLCRLHRWLPAKDRLASCFHFIHAACSRRMR